MPLYISMTPFDAVFFSTNFLNVNAFFLFGLDCYVNSHQPSYGSIALGIILQKVRGVTNISTFRGCPKIQFQGKNM